MLTSVQYMELAQVTANKTLGQPERWMVCLAGLAGELGEIFELFKKFLGHGHELSKDKLTKECGDFMWYIAEAYVLLDSKLPELMVPYPHVRPYAKLWHVQKSLSRFAGAFDCTLDLSDAHWTEFCDKVNTSAALVELDVIWHYFQDFIAANGLDIQDVMQVNIDKLAERYPAGFTHWHSINRKENVDATERGDTGSDSSEV